MTTLVQKKREAIFTDPQYVQFTTVYCLTISSIFVFTVSYIFPV